jgi:hypothetical protein
MKPKARDWLIRSLFELVVAGYTFQAAISLQAHSWPDALRSSAIVSIALVFVGRPQLLLQSFPLSISTIRALPSVLKCSVAAGGVLLLASFIVGESN